MKEDQIADPSPRKYNLGKTIIKAGEIAGGLAAIGGFVGDFLKPLASINLIVFTTASVLTVVLLVLAVKRRTVLGYGFGVACFFSLLIALGFGTWWGLAEFKGGQEHGILASTFGVVGRVQGAVIDVQKVDGERATTEFEAKETSGTKPTPEETRKLLAGYPAKILSAKTVGGLRPSEGSGDEFMVSYDIVLGVDAAAYEKYAKRLVTHLESVALRKGETFSTAKPDRDEKAIHQNTPLLGSLLQNEPYEVSNLIGKTAKFNKLFYFDSYAEGDRKGFGFDWWGPNDDAQEEQVVVLNVSRNQVGDRTTWKWYHIRKLKSLPSQEKIDVTFLDSRGREIVRDVLTLGPTLPGLVVTQDSGYSRTNIIVSPFLVRYSEYANDLTMTRRLKMTKAELKAVASIQCSAAPTSEIAD